MNANVKFSEDIVALKDIKINPGKVVKQVEKTHRPVLLTNRGRGVAVIQSVDDYEAQIEERDLLKAILKGLDDVEQGRVMDLESVKKRFGL